MFWFVVTPKEIFFSKSYLGSELLLDLHAQAGKSMASGDHTTNGNR